MTNFLRQDDNTFLHLIGIKKWPAASVLSENKKNAFLIYKLLYSKNLIRKSNSITNILFRICGNKK
ncbi:hypothetical protein A8C56_11965 [Niabella ginsenosidivorans]|uniref:Uncharacterized protein n=1 Tax=Niabella ginsenosidivorans TaxID=1176587 RepID=A0A1A9I2N5_9BACT|nr:hypothetical protein A8C56_11965 [Niabella ginsenosidivorans]